MEVFPFKRQYLGQPDDLLPMFERIASVSQDPKRFSRWLLPGGQNKKKSVYIYESADYDNMDILGDYFTELERLRGRKSYCDMSPAEMWNTNTNDVRTKTLESSKDVYEQREKFYTLTVRECEQFRPSFTAWLYHHLKASKVLDMCAGWGDRLIGALAAEMDTYHAFDPNTRLKPGHDEILKVFPPHALSDFKIHYKPFETSTVELQDDFYDIAFTSPPYFNLEIYSNDASQSSATYPTLQDWLQNFLFRTVSIAWRKIRTHGYLALHIDNYTRDANIVGPLLAHMRTLPNCVPCETIHIVPREDEKKPFRNRKKPRPVFIWTKFPNTY